MTYLELVNDFLIETSLDDQVSTLAGAYDDVEKAAVWIRDAWLRIQRSRADWNFMWAEGSFDTVASQSLYTKAQQNLTGRRKRDSLYIASERKDLEPVSVRSLRYATGEGVPYQYAIKPDDSLILHYTPDAVYQVDYEYYSAPVVLSADSDEPTLPDEFHKLIVVMAIEDYAREQGRQWQGLYKAAGFDLAEVWNQLVIAETPDWGGKVGID